MERLAVMAVRPDLSDHEPGDVDSQGHARCVACGYRWPCPDVRLQPRGLDADERLLLEVADIGIGYTVWRRLPDESEVDPVGGIVIGWDDRDDDGDEVRVFTVVDWRRGRPVYARIRADEVEPATIGLPNSAQVRGQARQLAGVIAKSRGVVSPDEVDHAGTVLSLLRSIA